MHLGVAIEKRIADSHAESVGVAFQDLETGEKLLIDADESFHAASTMKVPVLVELFHQAELGNVSLVSKVKVRNQFFSLADGSAYTTEVEDDGEKTLYQLLEEDAPLIDVATLMITHSSNLGTNLLMELLGAENVNAYMAEIGLRDLVVRRGVMDMKAFNLGMNNKVTASALMSLAAKLARGEVVSPAASEAMIGIMRQQFYLNSIPAKLPADANVANKTGSMTMICHDFGIVYPPSRGPFVLAVLTRGLQEDTAGPELISDIASLCYAHALAH
ncbi:MAG TPA: serine hydrolase [Fimbriimonadaceae bacterium]